MAGVMDERVCGDAPDGVVVFLIGMRLNKPWKLWKWLPVARAMPRMLEELGRDPTLGLLHARMHFALRDVMVVQYWRSAEALLAYAHAPDRAHLPAWQAFNRVVGTSGDIGIWHETYVVPPGHAESIYVNMPPFGLGRAGTRAQAAGAYASARKRLRAVLR